MYYFGHGFSDGPWGEGGLQITKGTENSNYMVSGEVDGGLRNRFAGGADVYLHACQVARSSLPQAMADNWGVNVHASRLSTKFFTPNTPTGAYPPMVQYAGDGIFDPQVRVEQQPYLLGTLHVGDVKGTLARFTSWRLRGNPDKVLIDLTVMARWGWTTVEPK